LNIQSLDLSIGYVSLQDASWWKLLSTMLINAHIPCVVFSLNSYHQIPDKIWNNFCDDLDNTDVQSIKLTHVTGNRWIVFKEEASKAEHPNRFFQPEKSNQPTRNAQLSDFEQYVIS